MKKLLSLICLFSVLFVCECAYATKSISLDSINCEISIDDSWVIITKDMDSVDIWGTPFDIEGMQSYMDSIVTNLKKEQFSNVQAMVYAHINDITYEWQIWIQETKETSEYWDVSLHKQDIEALEGNKEFVDQYTTPNNDFFFATIEESDGTDLLMHMTINNGRGIIVSSMASEEVSFETTLTQTHKLLDSLKFTKNPKAEIHSIHEKQSSDKTGFFDVMLDKFLNYFIYNLSWSAVSLLLGGIALLVSGIIWLFKFIRDKVQSKTNASKLYKDRAYVLTVENSYRLKWHKILIYFGMWISALSLLASGIMLLSGSHYGAAEDRMMVYTSVPNLKYIDISFGVIYLCLAALCVKIRNKLATFQKKSVKHVILLTIGVPVIEILYLYSIQFILGETSKEIGLGITYENLFMAIVFAIILHVYYQKRQDLFE